MLSNSKLCMKHLYFLLTLLSMVISNRGAAKEYRVPIIVSDETDIMELYYNNDISDEEKDTLLTLLTTPLDLNRASRDELYDLPGLTYALVDEIIRARRSKPFGSTDDLLDIPGITPFIYNQLRPFIMIRKKPVIGLGPKVSGKIRTKVVDQLLPEDQDYPETYIRIKAKSNRGMQAGALVLGRNTIFPPQYRSTPQYPPVVVWKFDREGNPKSNDGGLTPSETDTLNSYLYTRGPTWLPAWPKFYFLDSFYSTNFRVQYLLGSYRIGFGQRVVFDNTGKTTPTGFIPDLDVYEGLSDFTMFKGLTGTAARITSGNRSEGVEFQATPFFSWWRYDLYYSRVKHKETLGPQIDYSTYKVVTPYKQTYYRVLNYQTLPQAYSELLGGGSLQVSHKAFLVGLVGYYSKTDFWIQDEKAVFATSSAYPERDTFAAFGVYAQYEGRPVSIFAEAGTNDEQAPAGFLRGVYDTRSLVVDFSLRYVPHDYDNPHSRIFSEPDQYEGDRDRGEKGMAVRISWKTLDWLRLRLEQDLWQAVLTPKDQAENNKTRWRGDTFLRFDLYPVPFFSLGLFVQFTDKDLTVTGRDRDYSEDGEKIQTGIQLTTRFLPYTVVWAYYKLSLYDAKIGNAYQRDHYFIFRGVTKPSKFLSFTVRTKYLKGELEELLGTSREHYVDTYFQVRAFLSPTVSTSLRWNTIYNIDEQREQKRWEHLWKAMAEYRF